MRALYRAGARALCSRAAPIRGTVIAEQVLDGVRKDVASLQSKHGITPGLAVIVVGGRKDSLKYVQKKQEAEGFGSFRQRCLRRDRRVGQGDDRAFQCRPVLRQHLLQLPLPAPPPHEILAIDPTRTPMAFTR